MLFVMQLLCYHSSLKWLLRLNLVTNEFMSYPITNQAKLHVFLCKSTLCHWGQKNETLLNQAANVLPLTIHYCSIYL